MRRWMRAVGSLLPGPRATPFTFVLLLMLAATTAALRWGATDDASVLRWASTNLVNLNHHPVSSLLASAFVSEGNITFDFIVLAVACAVLERRSTAMRTALVITGGHVIATLVSEGAVRIAITTHSDPRAAARQLDVGISYVMYTAVGAALGFLPARWRRLGLLAAVGYVGVPFLSDPGLTTGGHVLSLAIGLASWPFLMPTHDRAAASTVRRPVRFAWSRPGRLAWSRATPGSRLRIGALAALTAAGVLTACAPGHYLLGRHGHAAHCSTAVHCAGGTQPGN